MDIILNLKEEADWASELNKDIEQAFPEYFLSNPKLGTPEWWNRIDEETSYGRITHVGEYLEEGELVDVVVIQQLDEELNDGVYGIPQQEYSVARDDYWLNEAIRVDRLVFIKSVVVYPSGELDEHAIYIETQVALK
ncbi:hypothetical protein AltI4_21230 [Alteromonas sp. I4]|nr:hypothetical protein AltI4_21230 [Alteromonas sp. I4]